MMYLGNQAVGLATLKELNGIFTIVHRFTPVSDEQIHTMPNFGPGVYIVCEEPILTIEKWKSESRENNALHMTPFTITRNNRYNGGCSATIINDNGNGVIDYWGTYGQVTEDTITFGTSTNHNIGNYKANRTYIVLKSIIGGDI